MTNSPFAAQLTAARSGDKQAFSDVAEPYRTELLVHCYRLLGSAQDAEDMVQETFLRAWNRLDRFEGGQYFRAWLYKIATNLCLDALDKRSRRVLVPSGTMISEPIWLEPFPDELLPESSLSPEARYTQRESISLAFLAALQLLPPWQRAILILCDVLDWHASEAAQLLDITIPAVNGLLRRARATMNNSYRESPSASTIDTSTRDVLNRYVEAWESGDVDTLISLLTDKIVFTMPPKPAWFVGLAAVKAHAESMFSQPMYQRWRVQQTRANNQIAIACYRYDDRDGLYHAHALQLLIFENGQIDQVHMFLLPQIFPRFGLSLLTK